MPTPWRLSLGPALFAMALGGAAQTPVEENMTVNARFLLAARNADATGMKRGLTDGAAVNSRNRLGESALIVVLKKNRVDLAQLVIDAGVEINQPALNGITALMAAAYEGQTEMARQLLAKGANPAALDRLHKNAMIYAAGEGWTGVVTLLLANGIDPNAVYHNNLTALMWAAGFGKTDTVRALLVAGANPQLKDNRGKTAADIAREQNFAETVQLLDGAPPAARAAAK